MKSKISVLLDSKNYELETEIDLSRSILNLGPLTLIPRLMSKIVYDKSQIEGYSPQGKYIITCKDDITFYNLTSWMTHVYLLKSHRARGTYKGNTVTWLTLEDNPLEVGESSPLYYCNAIVEFEDGTIEYLTLDDIDTIKYSYVNEDKNVLLLDEISPFCNPGWDISVMSTKEGQVFINGSFILDIETGLMRSIKN